jgi:hypothetical protein
VLAINISHRPTRSYYTQSTTDPPATHTHVCSLVLVSHFNPPPRTHSFHQVRPSLIAALICGVVSGCGGGILQQGFNLCDAGIIYASYTHHTPYV